eukprot:TRINITY_DN27942_c0_g1_i1.p1 TRINITY_DN27942_c0_g1~~TRINITY_DN27942_c0_g1_i1.p1  ORF type:complete len:1612 (+),score=240.77 TRINITY_DN27942_c0_g1_i1:56-4891(+)
MAAARAMPSPSETRQPAARACTALSVAGDGRVDVASCESGVGSEGVRLLERTLKELSSEDLRRVPRPVEWDARHAELSTAVKSRIPFIVEERCRSARTRTNCGLIAEARHAWVSADSLLHIWDYRQDDPTVVVVPADSAIVSVATCPPKPNVFDSDVHLLLVICTRATVSLVGLSLTRRGVGPAPLSQPRENISGGPLFGGGGGVAPVAGSLPGTTGSLRLVPLDGFVTQTNGAVFHSISHTADGHILLACGAPQLYELAYSRSPGLFHSKCRLVRHATGFWTRMRDLLPGLPHRSGRLRIVQCAPGGFAISVDDASTLRLFRLRDKAVHKAESVAVLEELASLTIDELAAQHFSLMKVHMASRMVTHVFPSMGLDGNLRLRIVTSASERMLLVCSAASPSGPAGAAATSTASKGQPENQQEQQRYFGFWLQQATESRLGHGGSTTTCASRQGGSWTSSRGGLSGLSDALLGTQGTSSRRASCLEEQSEPCVHSKGVWVAAVHRPGVRVTEVGLTVRVEDYTGNGTGVADLVNMFTSLTFDCQVFHIVEEGNDIFQDLTLPVGRSLDLRENDVEGGPGDFSASRTFAIFLESSVQVFRLSLRANAPGRQPGTPEECCAYLMQLARPVSAGPGVCRGGPGESGSSWSWTFDDVGFPSFDMKQRHRELHCTAAPLHLGRWFCGLLRFLAIVLRPIWNVPLVVPAHNSDSFSLGISETSVRKLLSQLRPVLLFARQGLKLCSSGVNAHKSAPVSVAARSRLYSSKRTHATEGVAQAHKSLSSVLDLADRVQQILGLMNILHSQRNAYRVLQSPVLAGASLNCLLETPLARMVATSEALAPVVGLCSAFVMESGLTTPAAELVFDARSYPRPHPGSVGKRGTNVSLGGSLDRGSSSGHVCNELEEQCPNIFAQVDLALIRTRLGTAGGSARGAALDPTSSEAAGELLRRYAQCVGPSSEEARWAVLARSVEAMALENPRGAVDVCVEKLQQLETQRPADLGVASGPGASRDTRTAALSYARVLLEALLGTIGLERSSRGLVDHTLAARTLVEHLLTKTSSLTLGIKPEGGFEEGGSSSSSASASRGNGHLTAISSALPLVHVIILDCLLQHSRLRPVLEALSDTKATDVEAFLRRKFDEDDSAGELLWKLLLTRDRVVCASQVLLQLAERPASRSATGLSERLSLLDLARQAAGRGLPEAKELYEKLGTQQQMASRVQVPLYHELHLIADDGRVSERWRRAAAARREELRALRSLQDLYQVANEFGLFHIVLVIADLASSVQERGAASSFWVSVFLPPAGSCPYLPSELLAPPAAAAHGLFPLLLVRRRGLFFARVAGASSEATAEVETVRPGDFQSRVRRFLEELSSVTRTPGPLWDVRCLGPLLEYCSCLWLRATLDDDDEQQVASDNGNLRSWVALSVFARPPFSLGPLDVLKFYCEMITHLPAWLPDLCSMLPPLDRRGDHLRLPELQAHLCEVLLDIVGQWTSEAPRGVTSPPLGELRAGWPIADAAFALLVEGMAGRDGQSLLGEARRSRLTLAVEVTRKAAATALGGAGPGRTTQGAALAGASATITGTKRGAIGAPADLLGDLAGDGDDTSRRPPLLPAAVFAGSSA